MIAVTLAFCAALGRATFEADDAFKRGVTLTQAQAAAAELPTPEARRMGADVIWYVYVSNNDKRLSSRKLASLVERACIIRMGEQ